MKDEHQHMTAINHILYKNRRILISFYSSNSLIVTQAQLQAAGYNFKYLTHVLQNAITKEKYNFVYEYGFTYLLDGKFSIAKKQHGEDVV